MRSPSLRHVIHLRLTLDDHDPVVWREVVVDREATLADLHQIVATVLGGPRCTHHVFTDGVSGTRATRRWGDKWTMIDYRDPTVVDETTARIGTTLARHGSLVVGHTCETGWTVVITPGIDDIVPVSEPLWRVIDGFGRIPLPCSRGPLEHGVIVAALDDPAHPDHEVFREHESWLRGPWADPGTDEIPAFDVPPPFDDQSALVAGPVGPTLSFVAQLPPPAQPGARRHVALAGVDLPTVVTSAEMGDFLRVFRWFILRAGADGIPVQRGVIEPAFLADAAAVLDVDEHRLQQVHATAKRLQLVYSRHGHLRAKKAVLTAAASASTLWSSLAEAVRESTMWPTSAAARDLLLLSIADGSLESGTGMPEIAHAHALITATTAASRRDYWHEEHYRECVSRCECPVSVHGSWHDLVTESVRRASEAAREDGAETVLARLNPYDDEVPRDWMHGHDAQSGALDPYRATLSPIGRRNSDREDLPHALAPTIEVLEAFGLAKNPDGSWTTPPALREFARTVLAGSLTRAKADGTHTYDYVF